MSKIQELIEELCPNGVEYVKIEELCSITRGRVMSKDYIKDNIGDYPVYSSQTENYGELGRISTYDFDGEYLTWTTDGANAGSVFYRNGRFSVTNVCGLLKVINSKIVTKFLYYILSVETPKYVNKGMGNPKLMSNVMARIRVAVPPMEVQQEIVRVLDNFSLLSAELSAELKARQKQYEYYRDELLKPKDTIPMVKLKDIATDMYRGNGIKREQVTEIGIPCVRYGEIYTTYNTWFDKCVSHTKLEYVSSPKYFEHGDILFAITGESVEDIAKSIAYIGNEKCLAGGDIVVMKHKQNPRYIAHVLNTKMAREQKSKGKIKSKVVHSNVPSIEQIEIPLPSLKIQERYAEVLDNFETICNSLNIGLPAEIEKRQQQYEFYRDLLLTFAEQGDSILREEKRREEKRREEKRREEKRREEKRRDIIKLIQYVFGCVKIELGDVCNYGNTKIEANKVNKDNYVGVDNLLQDKKGKTIANYIPKTGKISEFKKDDILIGNIRPYLKKIWISNINGGTNGDVLVVRIINDLVIPKYLYYVLSSDEFFIYDNSNAKGAKMPRGNKETILKYKFFLPTIEEQEKIVNILDRFDKLCNDISDGLPAEIEARQKQYECYRDKLLIFKEVGA